MPYDDKILRTKLERLNDVVQRIPMLVGQMAVNHSRDSFEEQGWRDGRIVRWQAKKEPNNYPILRSKSSAGLVDTIRWEHTGTHRVTVFAGNNLKPYARIHNEGGSITVPVTPKMRKYAWAMSYTDKGRKDKWKAIALTKKSEFKITIPKRQYLGWSKTLEKNIIKAIDLNFKRALR